LTGSRRASFLGAYRPAVILARIENIRRDAKEAPMDPVTLFTVIALVSLPTVMFGA
jgi:hypothetical protein